MRTGAAAFCILALLTPFASAQDHRVGTLKSVTGLVDLGLAANKRSADVGSALLPADRITTGRHASATFMLKDGTVVSVGPNSTLELAKVQFDTTTQQGNLVLDLLQGSIRVITGWLGKLHPEQVKVMTPTSVVGVRGTDFIVEVP
jgi:hypothetical protein